MTEIQQDDGTEAMYALRRSIGIKRIMMGLPALVIGLWWLQVARKEGTLESAGTWLMAGPFLLVFAIMAFSGILKIKSADERR